MRLLQLRARAVELVVDVVHQRLAACRSDGLSTQEVGYMVVMRRISCVLEGDQNLKLVSTDLSKITTQS